MNDIFSSKVVVITGASSGIGRQTALDLAKKGARVVLAARGLNKLKGAAKEIESFGGEALAVKTDVSVFSNMQNLAKLALKKYGRIDVWINNAGVLAFGKFEDIPVRTERRIMAVNFFGVLNGCEIAVPLFKKKGRGIIINISSVIGLIPQPYSATSVASKAAVRRFSESLRLELLGTKVKVCVIFPASIDTPLFQHAANYTGHAINPMKPLHSPKLVSDAIVGLIERPQFELIVGASTRVFTQSNIFSPFVGRSFRERTEAGPFQGAPSPVTDGNLFKPMRDRYTITGEWLARQKK